MNMNIRDVIYDILSAIYKTDKINSLYDTEERYKMSFIERLIEDMIEELYEGEPIYNDGYYSTIKSQIISQYNYQISNKNELGHAYLSYWPKYKN